MSDRLVSLLRWFELRANVFQVGPLCETAAFRADDGYGYIHVLRAGSIDVKTSGRRRRLRLSEPGLVFYMTPTTHQLTPLGEGADTVCASFEFGGGLVNPLVKALPDLVHLRLSELPNVTPVTTALFNEAAEEHCGRQAILNRLVEVLIIQLLRELMDQDRISSGLLAGLADLRLAKAINAIHADPAQAWTLEGLAELASMSRARFAHHFRERVGMTPMAYLSEWRLGTAQALLRQGTPVQIVADRVGYGSASALSRAFVAQFGMSPRAWKSRQVESP